MKSRTNSEESNLTYRESKIFSNDKIGDWESYTKGVGSKLLEKVFFIHKYTNNISYYLINVLKTMQFSALFKSYLKSSSLID